MGIFIPPLERNSGINIKFYKFDIYNSNLSANTLDISYTKINND